MVYIFNVFKLKGASRQRRCNRQKKCPIHFGAMVLRFT